MEKLESLVEAIKNRVQWITKKKKKSKTSNPYMKMGKSASVKMEIKSRNARRLIDRTLEAADHPGKIALPS
ncbi:uncharacterized protein LOC122014476 [Zingiber officinale]|uniref:Uncharacterized protein n=1 Tax=Zingiber officinale TaxID=94328 RepID=A0A8J5F777_ZINOF|nr:uncharacterized protein LOC122014476 [Zingiber officinale]KAG6480538.1 hypothetical protein ZIOFF_057122 [Zingiber officinale]